MINIPSSVKNKISNPCPDIESFISVLKGSKKPQRVHLAELFADQEVMQWVTTELLAKQWVPLPVDIKYIEQMKAHLLCEIEYWFRMGYDYIRVIGGVEFPNNFVDSDDTAADLSRSKRVWAGSSNGLIQNWDDFEAYKWPHVKDEDMWMYEFVAENLPDGMGIMACPASGFFEIPSEVLIGYESMAMLSMDNPALLDEVFKKVRNIFCSMYKKIVDIENVYGFFQGDDMGYKTGLLMSPNFFKNYSLIGHRLAAEIAHSKNKIYMLHSCGKLDAIIDYLVDEVKIDARHSYEDVICPVEDFYEKYSAKIAILGGIDVNLLGSASENVVRKRVRGVLEKCHNSGRYALGSGNTITNYCKKENILAMFDEAFSW